MRFSAKRFFRKTLKAIHTSPPRVITVNKNPAYPKASKELKAAKKLPEIVKLRQIKYLNNIVEQDHRGIKRLIKTGMGFGSFNTARRTIRGYEIMNMMRKGQVLGVAKGAIKERIIFINQIFGVVAPIQTLATGVFVLTKFWQHNRIPFFTLEHKLLHYIGHKHSTVTIAIEQC